MLAVTVQKKYLKIPKYFNYADILEIRVDLIDNIDLRWTERFLKKVKKPWILTIRKNSQGGNFKGSEELRLKTISEYLKLKPTYIDIEHDVDLGFVRELKKKHSSLKFIRSFHDFQETPHNIEEFVNSKYDPFFDIHKFAFRANSMKDTLKLMCYLKKRKDQRPVALIAMGKHGHPLRVCGKILRNAISYASINESNKIASQLSVRELTCIYNYPMLNHSTKIYALIGKSISHSIGHLFHNFFFSKHDINAVYVKIPLNKQELSLFFKLAKDLPIYGLSVTTPFKLSLSTYLADAQGPINTLKRTEDGWQSKNTDGIGAFNVLKKYLKENTRILLFGSGPTALSVFEVLKEKFLIDIYSRNYQKTVLTYPEKVKVIKDFSSINFSDYDLVINAASYKADFLNKVARKNLKTEISFFDVNYQKENNSLTNPFIRKIAGKELFFSQAIYQQVFWNEEKYSFETAEEFKRKWKMDRHQP